MTGLGRVLLLTCGLALPACGHLSQVDRRVQEDGSYRVECKAPLTRCLTAIEEVCEAGYEILQAHEDRRYSGPREINEPAVTSRVIARCRGRASSLEAPDGSARPAVGASAVVPPPASPGNCFPGATQACVGPGACRGGQRCLADGVAFGPCDCGVPAAEPTTPVPDVRDGGAPP